MVAGALSTRFLASTSPRPVSSRTALITAILFAPIDFKTTSNSVFSSAAGAAAPTAPPATATGAAALTPNSYSIACTSSLSSNTERALISSINFFVSIVNFSYNILILVVPYGGNVPCVNKQFMLSFLKRRSTPQPIHA